MEAGSPAPRKRERPYWYEGLAPYAKPDTGKAVLDLLTSVVPYVALSVAMYMLVDVSAWLVLALAFPASGFLLRTFIVFHDCTHGSFIENRRANLWIGRLTALLVFQPFANWRHNHAVHHGSAGDIERRGTGDVETLTVDEYLERSPKGRFLYRAFRNPFVMLGIGPLWSLMFGPRLWSKKMRPRSRHSVWLTNAVLAAYLIPLWYFLGFDAWLLVQMPTAILAGTAGVFLFYVQHQFEDVYWEMGETWSYDEAALRGSSYLKLPKVLQFFSGNIGLHHVHHLSAKVPNYNLQGAHDANEIFHDVPVLTIRDGLRAMRLKVIDPADGRLLTWAEVRERREAAPQPRPVPSG